MGYGLLTLPPGLRGYVAGNQQNMQEDAMNMNKVQGLLSVGQQMTQQKVLQQQMEDMAKQKALFAQVPEVLRTGDPQAVNSLFAQISPMQALQGALPQAPDRVDLGDRIGLIDRKTGQINGYIPKGATPDAQLKESGAMARHEAPSGGDRLRATVDVRGQDMTDSRTRSEGAANRGVTLRGQDLTNNREMYLASPEYQAQLAGAKTTATEKAKNLVDAQANLPQLEGNVKAAVANIEAMIGKRNEKGELVKGAKVHPGFEYAVGATVAPGMRFIPGSSAADFVARLDQVKGGAFLQAFETLKGGGQITQVEGEKATAAITRMSTAQSEREFVQAAREYQDILRKGLERAKTKASGGASVDALLEKYR
jgi:hypothetical protein